MSKAFVRETDFVDLPDLPSPVALLPPGAHNYLTPAGAERLRAELARLVDDERAPLTAAGADPDAKRELKALDQRIRYLQHSLSTAEIVEPPSDNDDVVRFGAHITVRENNGDESHYRLVGVDEADPGQGAVSWLSPLAQALINSRRGERVRFYTPGGEKELEIVRVDYDHRS